MAVATWAATAVTSAVSSLLSGSPLARRPNASTAMAASFVTHGTK